LISRALKYLQRYKHNTLLIYWYEKFIDTEYMFIFTLAVFIGLLTGLVEVFLIQLIHFTSHLFFTGHGKTILEKISNSPWYLVLILPTLGIMVSVFINKLYFQKSTTHGVASIIEAVLLRSGIIQIFKPILRGFTTAITIGTGGSVGPEGPAAYLGAGIGSSISQFFNVNPRRTKTLVAAGTGAGIAAAFNAPIAGALFAVEIILMEFKFKQFSAIVISTVLATFVSRSLNGDNAVFHSSSYMLHNGLEFILFALMGVLSGIFSWLFIITLDSFENYVHNKVKINSYIVALIGGTLIGVTGIFLPDILGTGYDTIDKGILNNLIWYIALAIVIVKILTTSLTLASGGAGGVFAPALVVGATLGAFFGEIFYFLTPNLVSKPEAFVFVGMAGLLAGTMHAPFTSIIMIFELTKNQDYILPTMITSILSVAITKKLIKDSIYTKPLANHNINLHGKTELNVLDSLAVKDVYKKQYEVLYENSKFIEVIDKVLQPGNHAVAVLTLDNKYYGLISINMIKEVILDIDIVSNLLIAGDIAEKYIPKVTVNQSLKNVWEKMNKSHFDFFPVVEEDDENILLGILFRQDIDEAYNQELERFDLSTNLATIISEMSQEKHYTIVGDYILTEIDVPNEFIGKSIKELDVRNSYEVEIITIKSFSADGAIFDLIPKADYVFKKSDKLIITAKPEIVNKLENLGIIK